MNQHALDERHELSRTLRATAPDAPTLCGDWTAALLTAHLVQRERSITEVLGRLPVGSLRRRAEHRLAELVAARGYEQLVDEFEAGPPALSPWAIPQLREAVNLLEYAVHHEDVRRAHPGVAPRPLSVARQRAIWQRLRFSAPMTMRAVPVGVRLVAPSFGATSTRRVKSGGPVVTVTAEPLELALLAFGRQRVAQVHYDGAPADIARLTGTRIGV
jgi:uncharacterized protein (TIGR03085 family)